jgi:putative salt-induced outer membrane protein
MTRRTAAAVAIAIAIALPAAGLAQSGALPPAFSDAVRAERPLAAQTFLLGAISRDPGNADAALSAAFRQAPQYADLFSRTVADSFPGLAGGIPDIRAGAGLVPAIPAVAEVPPSVRAGGFSAPAGPSDAEGAAAAEAEAERKAFPPGDGWDAEIEVGGSHTTGNTDTQDLFAGLEITYDGSRWHHEIGASFQYSRENRQVSSQRLVFDYEPRYDFTQRFFGFGFFEYRNDRFSGFNYELTESLGVGYRVLRDAPFSWMVQAGPALRLSEDEITGDVSAEFGALVQSDFEWRISDSAEFSNETTLVFAQARTVTTNVAALTLRIYESLKGRLSFEVRNDSDPAPGTEATDTTTKATLVYGF